MLERSATRAIRSCWALIAPLALFSQPHRGYSASIADIHDFSPGDSGAASVGRLLEGRHGSYYGTTLQGGAYNWGVVYKVGSDGSYSTIHSFTSHDDGGSPNSGLVSDDEGNAYGVTGLGGSRGYGTIYKIGPHDTFTTVYSFGGPDGASPQGDLILGRGHFLYGTTSSGGTFGNGAIFKLSPFGALTTLYSFGAADGHQPTGTLVRDAAGDLYGTTQWGGAAGWGTVFKFTPGVGLTTLFSFSPSDMNDGLEPTAGLTRGHDGSLYGTTRWGGLANDGTVFKITRAGMLTSLHSFNFTDGMGVYASLVLGRDGSFYGTTYGGGASNDGTVFRITRDGAFTSLYAFTGTDGKNPSAALIEGRDGSLYGTTMGGTANAGTVFRIGGDGAFTTLHSFAFLDGANSSAPLVAAADGSFYGTTFYGGATGLGSVFKVAAGGAETLVHSFNGDDGSYLSGGLIQAADGDFYGATSSGGIGQSGTIFKLTPDGALTTMHAFNYGDGAIPQGALIQGGDGAFYGTTSRGGDSSYGTVFKMDSDGTVTTFHSFDYNDDGAYPAGGLVRASDGSLYGTTPFGGAAGQGTVFKIAPDGTFTNLYAFSGGSDGSSPQSALTLGSSGNLYGTTRYGGDYYAGNVFEITPDGVLTSLYSFSYGDGAQPMGGLFRGSDGNFYGTTSAGGAFGFGTVFQITPDGALTTLDSFNGANGQSPEAGLAQGADGVLYGTTWTAGVYGWGTVYRIDAGLTVSDLTPPTTTLALSGPTDSNGLYDGPVTVTLTATDPDGAADVASTVYSLDGGSDQTYTGPFVVSSVGSHQITYHSVDRAGNTEEAKSSGSFYVGDGVTPPIYTLTFTGHVIGVDDAGSHFDGTVSMGAPLTATVTVPMTASGGYYPSQGPSYGVTASFGDYTYAPGADAWGDIVVLNDLYNGVSTYDWLGTDGQNGVLSSSAGPVTQPDSSDFESQFDDETATALTSDALPLSLALSTFNSAGGGFSMKYGADSSYLYYTIDSASVSIH